MAALPEKFEKLKGPRRVRQDRALEVLEWIGDDRAKAIRKGLAGGS